MEKVKFESETQTRIRGLSRLRKYARMFVMAGMVSGLPGGLKTVVEETAEYVQRGEIEKIIDLEKNEARVRTAYGDNFPYKIGQFYREQLEAKSNITEISNAISGKKVESGIDKPWGDKESVETPAAIIEPLRSKDGMLDKESVERIMRAYPIGWINNEIESVQQGEKEEEVEYEGVKRRALASCYRSERASGKNRIVFHKAAERMSASYIINSTGHELAHANDWHSDNDLTAKERLALALKIAERIKAPDRFKSSYVESIDYKNDTKKTNYFRAVEYWAEICAQYFDDPTRLNIKDVIIIEEHIRKTDPGFNVKKANQVRQAVLAVILQKAAENNPMPESSANQVQASSQ